MTDTNHQQFIEAARTPEDGALIRSLNKIPEAVSQFMDTVQTTDPDLMSPPVRHSNHPIVTQISRPHEADVVRMAEDRRLEPFRHDVDQAYLETQRQQQGYSDAA